MIKGKIVNRSVKGKTVIDFRFLLSYLPGPLTYSDHPFPHQPNFSFSRTRLLRDFSLSSLYRHAHIYTFRTHRDRERERMGGQKFAVLLCAEDSDYVKKIYGGYYGVFVRMLKEEGEIWSVFQVAKGDFPSDDEIGEFDGFVITGSCNDAHGNDLWICRLLILLKKLEEMKKKVLGICFGHQILGRALGGKIDRAKAGWDIGITEIQLYPSEIFASLKMPASLSVIECHRDEIRELPPKAEVLAWSNQTGIEMFRYGNHIMGIQGHPEYTKDILLHLIDRLSDRALIEESLAEDAKTGLDASEPDREAWRKLCTNFLKGRL